MEHEILHLTFFQTQEEFSLLYLAQARDAEEFPKSGNVHKPRLSRVQGEEGDHVTDYPSSLDYRDKGHVTSVSSLAGYSLSYNYTAVSRLRTKVSVGHAGHLVRQEHSRHNISSKQGS